MLSALLVLALSLPLKLWPGTEARMEVVESEARNGYSCELIEYNVSESERVRSYLLVPSGASASSPRPGLVLLHDHGARFDIGKEKLVRPLAGEPAHIRFSAREWARSGFDGVFLADSLAALGYVVIVPDALYWGGRSSSKCQEWSRAHFAGEKAQDLKKEVYEGQRAVYDSLSRSGVIWAEKILNDDAAAARLLASLPYVQRERIGCFGWSMGAHRAWLLTAFCPDVKTGVALCWMTLKRTQASPPSASDYSMMIPALREKYDFPDIARALAPKPFLFLNGTSDKLFPVKETAKAFRKMQRIYRRKGAKGKLLTEFFEGGHHCGKEQQERVVKFLEDHLTIDVSGNGFGVRRPAQTLL